ncbi:MAG TPA: TIGR01440 family protein [Clostridia bacterium]|nr:TIGR01440 family protein [Clostridia bacterium]
MKDNLAEFQEVSYQLASKLCELGGLKPGQILVVGCSTSEVIGKKIGTAGSMEVAEAIINGLLRAVREKGVDIAVQCCEHLNRALVVEERVAERYGLTRVEAFPVPEAGGALASQAMNKLDNPVLVEEISAHAGIDIGHTLIGMHLRPVAVPVRIEGLDRLGAAPLVLAKTRPKLIGGARAQYRRVER